MRRAFFIEGPLACCKRSEEHTSELQSQSNLVCRLLLEKKNHEPRGPVIATVRCPARHILGPEIFLLEYVSLPYLKHSAEVRGFISAQHFMFDSVLMRAD